VHTSRGLSPDRSREAPNLHKDQKKKGIPSSLTVWMIRWLYAIRLWKRSLHKCIDTESMLLLLLPRQLLILPEPNMPIVPRTDQQTRRLFHVEDCSVRLFRL
jgi:hypothetical protein